MKIVYASRTGHVEILMNKLNINNPTRIMSGDEKVDEDFLLFTYTDGYGDIPAEVETFLEHHVSYIKEDYYKENSGIIFPNPNAPTGLLVSLDFIEDILKHNQNSIVVVDEAYIDFGGESAVTLLEKYPHLLITQTFSKFRSLAGIRLGVALGNQEIIAKLYDVKNSFNSYPIDSLAQVIGKASIDDSFYIKDNARKIIETREYTKRELKNLGFEMPDSYANFIFIKHPQKDAEEIFKKLRENGILVRYFKKPRIDQYLRVTIGTQEQMEIFIENIKKIID